MTKPARAWMRRAVLAATIGTTLAGTLLSMPTAGALTPPGDLAWSPVTPTAGSTVDVSFTGCDEGENVVVTLHDARGSGPGYDNSVNVTALATGVTNHASVVLPPNLAAGDSFGVFVECDGSKDPDRRIYAYGILAEAPTSTTTTVNSSSTTSTSITTGASTTSPASPTTSAPTANTRPETARPAVAVTGAPRYTG